MDMFAGVRFKKKSQQSKKKQEPETAQREAATKNTFWNQNLASEWGNRQVTLHVWLLFHKRMIFWHSHRKTSQLLSLQRMQKK